MCLNISKLAFHDFRLVFFIETVFHLIDFNKFNGLFF